ncbi:MAG TPA: hypothetical protein VK184_11670 [Nostocaceae cyanobacterium]|nr:hypothetical protein [Nostocaceae cyanobacterium]
MLNLNKIAKLFPCEYVKIKIVNHLFIFVEKLLMNLQEETIAKIRQMPECLVKEVNNFIDFLMMKHKNNNSDLSEYLSNLEDYEKRLARGEIKW